MKQSHIIFLSILVIDIVIFFFSIFLSSPPSYLHGALLLVIAVIFLFLGKDYLAKIK